MRVKERPEGQAAEHDSLSLMVLDSDASRSARLVAALEDEGYAVRRLSTPHEALQRLRDDRPDLLIWADGSILSEPGSEGGALRTTARELGIPVLDVIEDDLDPRTLADRHDDADDWVFRSHSARELTGRIARVFRRRKQAGLGPGSMPIDARFFPVVVHDLRTPLNVIGLSLRMIEQMVPRGNPDLEEDLRFVEENFKQIERMLAQLSDYYRLYQGASIAVTEFSPERLLTELVEESARRPETRAVPVRLEIKETCPREAALDPIRARQAIQYALNNAIAATKGGGIRITASGGPDRWVTEVRIDQPPPPTVKSIRLRPDQFERLCGTDAERRGMDLAIAARISELFGGNARLDVDEGRGSKIVLDWPARLPQVSET